MEVNDFLELIHRYSPRKIDEIISKYIHVSSRQEAGQPDKENKSPGQQEVLIFPHHPAQPIRNGSRRTQPREIKIIVPVRNESQDVNYIDIKTKEDWLRIANEAKDTHEIQKALNEWSDSSISRLSTLGSYKRMMEDYKRTLDKNLKVPDDFDLDEVSQTMADQLKACIEGKPMQILESCQRGKSDSEEKLAKAIHQYFQRLHILPVPVKPDVPFSDFASVLNPALQVPADNPSDVDKIKEILLSPYHIRYMDDGEIKETLILGKCSVWKSPVISIRSERDWDDFLAKAKNTTGLHEPGVPDYWQKRIVRYEGRLGKIRKPDDLEGEGSQKMAEKLGQCIQQELIPLIAQCSRSENGTFQIKQIDDYLQGLGILKRPVQAGEDYNNHLEDMGNPIFAGAEKADLLGKIKYVEACPYIIRYDDNGENEKFIIQGQCTVYRKMD